MLKLVDIKKDYEVADTKVHALKGISIEFRQNEFVSVLGASGCGKTTLLNIIGGLDRYTSGDLIIKGKSTKDFKDADWDVYRNRRIGFIFQSYNLIPHQTVLSNVEMALTIAGVPAEEKRRRAEKVLERVGLKEQLYKRPNQLSGGQMQRVAIARALVNNPEILLADEPTGALDSETSVQIMELIKEISGERLVVMVTHNPELAERYSTRIVRLHDGLVVSDSNPYQSEGETYEETVKEKKEKKEKKGKHEKTSMSFWAATKLSFRNLMSKRGRTTVTSIAGSIGIIGVSLVLAISAGVQNYISDMQDDMLSGNPVTIAESSYNLDALTDAMSATEKAELVKENGRVYIDSYLESLAQIGAASASMLVKNDITEEYVDYVASMPTEYYAAMTVDYGIDVLHSLYTAFTYTGTDGKAQTRQMSVAAIQSLYTALLKETDYANFSDYISMFTDIFAQAPVSSDGSDGYIASQYDIKAGKIATEKDEIMLVVNGKGESTDLLLAQLGILTQDQFLARAYKAIDGEYDEKDLVDSFAYEDLLNRTFTWYPNDSVYTANASMNYFSEYGACSYIYNPYGDGLEGGMTLKIVGILQPKETISYGCLSSGVYYTQAFAEYAVEHNKDSAIVSYAKSQNGTIMSGYSSYSMDEAPDSVIHIPFGVGYRYTYVYEGEEKTQMDFVGVNSQYGSMMNMFSSFWGISDGSDSESSYSMISSRQLGGEEVASEISVYPTDFESKDLATDYLDEWNDDESDLSYFSKAQGKEVSYTAEERINVTYTDSLELIISLIRTMVNIVTYALVAFTSISLVVSSVMISVITYVSVVERTKEIGVLRALGARKKDVKHLFNAEAFIIGLFAGAIGVGFTYLLSVPINLVLGSLTGIFTLAALPWYQAIIMVAVSVVLTSISGVAPASAAAKKDPVVALRTE